MFKSSFTRYLGQRRRREGRGGAGGGYVGEALEARAGSGDHRCTARGAEARIAEVPAYSGGRGVYTGHREVRSARSAHARVHGTRAAPTDNVVTHHYLALTEMPTAARSDSMSDPEEPERRAAAVESPSSKMKSKVTSVQSAAAIAAMPAESKSDRIEGMPSRQL